MNCISNSGYYYFQINLDALVFSKDFALQNESDIISCSFAVHMNTSTHAKSFSINPIFSRVRPPLLCKSGSRWSGNNYDFKLFISTASSSNMTTLEK
uniref:Uncharacterized protein n=1 Tax=Arundo donax TaxID=35708 RepID=A0A0A9GTX8_ARUDO